MNDQNGVEVKDPELDSEREKLVLLTQQLAEIKAQYDQLPETKPRRLTIPAIFNRAGDENFISDYLAYILDPERNGIGIEPLQSLLELAYDNAAEINLEQVEIEREYTFENSSLGRIDFLIRLGENGEDGVIGIENKIYSPEGNNQTAAYTRGVKEDFGDPHPYLIFLSPYEHKPISNEFKPVRYSDLAQALREIRYPVLKDIHKSVIWEDFLAHLEEYIVMAEKNLELSGKTRLYLDHRQELEGLKTAFEDDSQKLYDHVIGSIMGYFGEGWKFAFQGRNSYQEIDREGWGLGRYYLFYQYRFSRTDILFRPQFPFMLGAYPGKHAGDFIAWLKVNYPKIPEICSARGMEAFTAQPGEKASILIAYKSYPLLHDDITSVDKQFVQAAEEFSIFTPIIDEAVQRYRKVMEARG